MSDVKAPLIVVAGPNRYRPLAVFWTIVAAIVVGGGVTLQLMGPPPAPAAGRPADAANTAAAPAAASGNQAANSAATGTANSAAPGTGTAAANSAPPAPPRPDLVAAPNPDLEEPAPDFAGHFLPAKAKDGRLPMVVYKAPFDDHDKHPRVVLIIDGAGLSPDETMHLLDDVPGPVDIAFSAYMREEDADRLASEARKTGHECLLSIPMEPNNFPMQDEGEQMLRDDINNPDANKQKLEFALSRLPGCVGATGASDGMMGERFAQEERTGFSDVLEEVGKRGLLYLDPRTGSAVLHSDPETAISVVDLVVDQAPNPEQPLTADMIDQRLNTLEQLALKNGVAIGLAGPPQPVLLDRVAVWAHGLAARGVTLAPLSAVQAIPKPVDGDAN